MYVFNKLTSISNIMEPNIIVTNNVHILNEIVCEVNKNILFYILYDLTVIIIM